MLMSAIHDVSIDLYRRGWRM